jgi:hypothetical protein
MTRNIEQMYIYDCPRMLILFPHYQPRETKEISSDRMLALFHAKFTFLATISSMLRASPVISDHTQNIALTRDTGDRLLPWD